MPTIVRLPDLVIPNGQTKSNRLIKKNLRILQAITIYSPETLPEVVSVEVTAVDDSATDADYQELQSGGSDITLAAGKATVIDAAAFSTLRLSSGTAVAAERVFQITAQERRYS